ncbi:MAG: NUDIX domain-containing protein [SAR202 cluster bacterium]|nr:NUDIX domain-containing protein [SAR202 cluster bacterium]
MPKWEESYVGRLRSVVGNRRLITAGVRAAIVDEQGRFLFIRRRDNGNWGMVEGGVDLGDSIMETLAKEVKEETGLDVVRATLVAVYSEKRFWFTNVWGNEHQMVNFVFRVDEWSGTLAPQTDESTDARFFPVDELPEDHFWYRETIADVLEFDGTVRVK